MQSIHYKDKTIHIVSTAHVSKQSIEDVKEAIESIQPDAVAIELDAQRLQSLKNPNQNKEIDLKQLIKENKINGFLVNLVLSSFQKRLADDLDTQVGGEMLQAVQSAEAHNIPLRTIDRDVNITFKRITGNLSLWQKANLFMTLIGTIFDKTEISDEEIEALKGQDLLMESVAELDETVPVISQSILHERNQYMAEKLKAMPYQNIVAVVGAAHTQGIIECLEQEHNIRALETTPNKKKTNHLGYIIPAAIILMLVILTFKQPNMALNKLIIWIASVMIASAVGAIAAGGHPLTVLTAFLTAPFGTLSPFISVGIFSGLTQLYVKPPKGKDFETLSNDIGHVKTWYSNRVLRTLLIVLSSNMLSSLATFIVGGNILSTLFK